MFFKRTDKNSDKEVITYFWDNNRFQTSQFANALRGIIACFSIPAVTGKHSGNPIDLSFTQPQKQENPID